MFIQHRIDTLWIEPIFYSNKTHTCRTKMQQSQCT